MALCSQVEAWLEFWHVWLVVNFILACVFTVWFLAGGLRDLRRLFAHLDRAVRDHQDDGSVGAQAAAASFCCPAAFCASACASSTAL